MKKTKIISTIALFAITLTMLAGCGTDPVQDDITDYINNQMPAVAILEGNVNKSFNSVIGDKYVDDPTMLKKIKDEVIPNSNKLIEKAKAVTVKTPELKILHAKYIAAKVAENSALIMIQTALENGDGDMVKKSNDLIIQAGKQAIDYVAEVNAFAKDHGLEVE